MQTGFTAGESPLIRIGSALRWQLIMKSVKEHVCRKLQMSMNWLNESRLINLTLLCITKCRWRQWKTRIEATCAYSANILSKQGVASFTMHVNTEEPSRKQFFRHMPLQETTFRTKTRRRVIGNYSRCVWLWCLFRFVRQTNRFYAARLRHKDDNGCLSYGGTCSLRCVLFTLRGACILLSIRGRRRITRLLNANCSLCRLPVPLMCVEFPIWFQ